MTPIALILLAACISAALPFVSLAAGDTSPTIIEITKAAHFTGSTGEDVIVEAGTYLIGRDGDGLRLIPTTGDRQTELLLSAQVETHTESVPTTLALFLSPAEDQVALALLFPEGESLISSGTLSGTRTRGTSMLQLSPTIQATLQDPNAPNPPDLLTPEDNVTFQASKVASPTQFRWKRAATGIVPQFYRFTMEDADNLVGFKTGIVEIPHVNPIVADPFVLTSQPIPPDLFDKQVRWSVSACVRTGGSGLSHTFCSSRSSRLFTWGIARPPAPSLLEPANGLAVTAVNLQFSWRGNSAAASYLLCVSKPGVVCPTSEFASADTIVTRKLGSQNTQGLLDLTRFTGQTVHWTVASCDGDNRCSYQQTVRAMMVVGAFPLRLIVDDLRALSITRNEPSLGGPRADEAYLFVSAALKTQDRLIQACPLTGLPSQGNVPYTPGCERFPKGNPDYYGLYAGSVAPVPFPIWQGDLGPKASAEISIIAAEQDNADRERVIRAGLGAVAGGASGIATLLGKTGDAAIFARDAMIEGGAALTGIGNALAQSGDDVLGGVMVVIKNEGSRVSVNFIPKPSPSPNAPPDTIVLPLGENAFSQTFLLIGGGAVYQLKLRVEPVGVNVAGLSYLARQAPLTGPTIPVQLVVDDLQLHHITNEAEVPVVGSNTADEIYFYQAGAVQSLGGIPQYTTRRTPPRGTTPRDII
jgi:hypothetical protein